MRVLVTGAAGQLGRALLASAPPRVEAIGLDRAALDIGDEAAVEDAVHRLRPALIVNAAAYTAVDKAETERDAARRINADGPGYLARAAGSVGARLVHVSTDFVFDGTASRPYRPADATAPLSVYGATKLAGEAAALAEHADVLVVRTAWVYAAHGRNFLETMLRLMAERDELAVVADQVGTPTHAASLAHALWALAMADARGVLHWTDAGVASWYDFAVAIREEAIAAGLPIRAAAVRPIATADYPTPAARPAFSLLDKSAAWGITGIARHWREELRAAMAARRN
ncbi:MAG: dTDP-4-dehydrorhamnose reductase [Sphingomonas sp.]|nr:dTDP-4-dehydrorhamnose reductase [Sphingomonas sp.]MDX3883419.1 dTDP-4-dehydrorhamnose reductase [Sphingomonas sp.]